MAHLIQIGNSFGIRIPKNVIQQAGLSDVELILTVVPEGVLISPQTKARAGWAQEFKKAGTEQKEIKLLQNVSNKFDTEEWEW